MTNNFILNFTFKYQYKEKKNNSKMNEYLIKYDNATYKMLHLPRCSNTLFMIIANSFTFYQRSLHMQSIKFYFTV